MLKYFCKLNKYISQTEQIFKTHEAAAFLVRHWHFVFMLTQSSATFSAKQDRNKSLRAIKAVKPGEASAVKTVNRDQHYTLRRSWGLWLQIQRHNLVNTEACFAYLGYHNLIWGLRKHDLTKKDLHTYPVSTFVWWFPSENTLKC